LATDSMQNMDSTLYPDPPARSDRPLIPSFLYGHAMAGAGLILMGYLLAYMIQFESLMGVWTGPMILTVVVMVMIMVLITVRNEEGGLRFGRAFGLSLLAGMLARLGYNLFNLLLFHVMRPDLAAAYVDLVMDKTNQTYDSFGGAMPGNMEVILERSTRFSISVPGQLLDAVMSVFWIGFVALIVAAVMKRNPDSAEGFQG